MCISKACWWILAHEQLYLMSWVRSVGGVLPSKILRTNRWSSRHRSMGSDWDASTMALDSWFKHAPIHHTAGKGALPALGSAAERQPLSKAREMLLHSTGTSLPTPALSSCPVWVALVCLVTEGQRSPRALPRPGCLSSTAPGSQPRSWAPAWEMCCRTPAEESWMQPQGTEVSEPG